MSASRSAKTTESHYSNAWADGSNRFPLDQLLREHGYTVFSRPSQGEPIYLTPDGQTKLTFTEALERLPKDLVKKVKGEERPLKGGLGRGR